MYRLNFTCNSLRFVHIIRSLPDLLMRRGKQLLLQALAAFFLVRVDQLFLFGAGRMALYTFLKSMNLQNDDHVLIVGYTCVVVPNAVKYTGAKVRYVDISEETLNIDTSKISDLISASTKVLIVSHNFGLVYQDIKEIKESFPDLVIIEDAAHVFGSVDSNGERVGTLGHASFFSFEYSKPITCGMGGLLIVNDEKFLSAVQREYEQLNNWSAVNRFRIVKSLVVQCVTANRFLLPLRGLFVRVLNLFKLSYTTPEQELQGDMPDEYPVLMSNFQAKLLLEQINDLESIRSQTSKVVAYYHNVFSGMTNIRNYNVPGTIYLRYPLLFGKAVSNQRIEAIKTELKRSGIIPGNWFDDVIYPEGSFRFCYNNGDCPVAESVSERIINLPVGIHSALSVKMMHQIIDCIEKH